jgi:MFS family permease
MGHSAEPGLGATLAWWAIHCWATCAGVYLEGILVLRISDLCAWLAVSDFATFKKKPTDITEDVIRELALPLGFVDIKVCAIDAIWSGRFTKRPYKQMTQLGAKVAIAFDAFLLLALQSVSIIIMRALLQSTAKGIHVSSIAIFRRLDRNVQLFLIATGLLGMTVLGGIFGVLFNLFVLRLGFGTEFVGIVNASGLLAFAAPSLFAGWLGTRWGPRPTILLGLAITALGYGLLALTDLLPADLRGAWLLTTNVIGSFGAAIYLVNTGPLLAAMTKPDIRAHALSVQVAVWPLAGFLGSLIGGSMPGLFGSIIAVAPDDPAAYRYTMLIAALLVLPAMYAILRTQIQQIEQPDAAAIEEPAPMRLIFFVALTIALQVGAEGVVTTFFNVYLDRALAVPTAQIGLMLAFARLASVPAALVTPTLIGRWGTRQTFVIASAGIVLFVIPLALVPNWLVAELGFLGLTSMAAIARSAMATYQMGTVSARWRSMMSGSATMGVGISWAALAYLGGYLISVVGYPILFAVGAGCTMLGVAVFQWLVPHEREERQ